MTINFDGWCNTKCNQGNGQWR